MSRAMSRLLFVLAFLCGARALNAQSFPTDDPILKRIWAIGMDSSRTWDLAQVLSDSIGPRLTGSPGQKAGNNWLIMAAIILGLGIESMTYAPYSALMAEMFPTHVRYTALSLCYQVAPIFAGSLAPLIAITLLNKYHSSTPIAWYLVGAALISIVAVGLTRETRGKSLHQVDAESAARIAALDSAAPATRRGDSLA